MIVVEWPTAKTPLGVTAVSASQDMKEGAPITQVLTWEFSHL